VVESIRSFARDFTRARPNWPVCSTFSLLDEARATSDHSVSPSGKRAISDLKTKIFWGGVFGF
jgi:hypothetical protein